MIINYGKKTLDITSGCKSLFGMDQDESGEEVICFLFVCLFLLFIYLPVSFTIIKDIRHWSICHLYITESNFIKNFFNLKNIFKIESRLAYWIVIHILSTDYKVDEARPFYIQWDTGLNASSKRLFLSLKMLCSG